MLSVHREKTVQALGTQLPNEARIKHFRRSWITACISAGLGTRITFKKGTLVKAVAHRIPHDFRRTTVRNLERAHVPRSAAMEMVGHKTMSIYSRYAICDESMLKDAGVKLAGADDVTRDRICALLQSRLVPDADGTIAMTARAWAVQGVV